MQRTFLGMEVYSKAMGSNMKRLLELHRDQVSKHTVLDFEKIRQVKYLHEFDRAVQVPCWGYPTEGAYYRDASSTDSLLASRIPIFAINAKDDPVNIVTRSIRDITDYPRLRSMKLCHTSRSSKHHTESCVYYVARGSLVLVRIQRRQVAC